MRAIAFVLVLFMSVPLTASAQFGGGGGGFGGRGGRGGMGGGGRRGGGAGNANMTKMETLPITDTELHGPMTAPDAQKMFGLSDEETSRYSAVRDSFMTATQADRDTAQSKFDKFRDAEESRDAAKASYFRDELKPLAKALKAQQDKFDDRVKTVFTKEHLDDYRKFRKIQDDADKKPVPAPNPNDGGRRGIGD